MKIGFDFDGVISENANFKCKKVKELYNLELEPWQVTSNIINTYIPDKKIRDHINLLSAQTIHHSFVDKQTISVLQELIDLGVELYIVTRRGKTEEGLKAAKDTINNLGLERFFKEIIYCETDNDKIKKVKDMKLDLFIDDRVSVIKNIQDKDVKFPILFDEYSLIEKNLLKYDENYITISTLKSVLSYVKILFLIDKAIENLVSQKIIDNVKEYKIISYLNNTVVKVNNYYLKIYNGNSTIKDNELLLYKKDKKTGLFKKLIYCGSVDFRCKYDFALFEPIKGCTLDNFNYTAEDAKKIAKSVLNFINFTSELKCKKFGDINEGFEGNYRSFREYIINFQHKTATTLYLEPSTRKYVPLLYNLLVKYEEKFDISSSNLIPVDLNFKNIMMTDKFEIKIVDPGSLIAGPLEMSYGEFCAHAYGTKIYDNFEKLIDKKIDKKLIRIYAIFMLLNILAFIVRNKVIAPELAKPFGNNKTFFELIDEHISFLEV